MPDSNLNDFYKEICSSYRAIDDFRAKLLGFLPLATSGIFLLANERINPEYLPVIGAFGVLITVGLLFYELHGINKCHSLIEAGKAIEGKLQIKGQFSCIPINKINESLAAAVIYSVVLAAWIYLFTATFTYLGYARWIILCVVSLSCFSYVYRFDKELRESSR